ncbi:MAG TPA: hypothetical protein VJQ84_00455, partial [Solirubrobacterales bacterium]|nr:hypothetical protein [Solirubrobacterales bacterium]
YAESRAEQVKSLLPLLASRATREAPVRVLLLVRASPTRTTDWAEGLRNQSDLLDCLLDECEMHLLEDLPLEAEERAELFEVAAGAIAARSDVEPPTLRAKLLESDAFASPLLVVLSSYLAVHGDEAPPSTREELLHSVLLHEERYWRSSAGDLFGDKSQPRQVIALATLLRADSESEAVEQLRLLPDFVDAPAERLGLIARWASRQYPGTSWWNPLEPDLVGEQLVADAFSTQPAVLSGALAADSWRLLIRPLEVLGRATANHAELATAFRPVLGAELGRLCLAAVNQAQDEVNDDVLYGKAVTLAAVLDKAISVTKVDRDALLSALRVMPTEPNLVLNPLALTLTLQLVGRLRRLAEVDGAVRFDLARALNDLSVCLAYVGRNSEGRAAIEESIEIYRLLARENPEKYEAMLATALNNLSAHVAETGQHEKGLAASEESLGLYRRLAAKDPVTYEAALARGLNNISGHLAEAGRHAEGLAASEECVEIRRRLAAENPATYEADLARGLNNLAGRLAEADRLPEALAVIEEGVGLHRRLAEGNPAAYQADLVMALNNLADRLHAMGRPEDSERFRREAAELLASTQSSQ